MTDPLACRTFPPMFVVKLHVIIAGFFLPAAVLFAVTGALYTFDTKGEYKARNVSVALELPPDPGLVILEEKAREILDREFSDSPKPSGKSGIKKAGTSWQFEWTGSRADFTLEPTAVPGTFKANYKSTTWHRFFVQLHKAKGGELFKYLAGALAVGFIVMFASGVLLALRTPDLRRLLYWSLGSGILIFIAAAVLS